MREIYERILTFGEYFSHMIETVKKRFGQYIGVLGVTIGLVFGWSIVVGLLMAMFFVASLPGFLQDPTAILSMTNDQAAAYLIKTLPVIMLFYFIILAGYLYISNVTVSMFYLITDSYVVGEKRPFGKMLSYSFRRAMPMFGTIFLYSLLLFAIWMVFMIVIGLLFSAMLASNLTQFQAFDDPAVLLGMWQMWVVFVLWLAMIAFTIYILIRYSFSVLGRAKYQFSAVQSLKYSRMLTRTKVAKIFGNMLLISLLANLPIILMSLGTRHLIDVGAVLGLMSITTLFSFVVYIFTASFQSIMYINFDAVRGADVISKLSGAVHNLKDVYFPHNGAQNVGYADAAAPQAPVAVPVFADETQRPSEDVADVSITPHEGYDAQNFVGGTDAAGQVLEAQPEEEIVIDPEAIDGYADADEIATNPAFTAPVTTTEEQNLAAQDGGDSEEMSRVSDRSEMETDSVLKELSKMQEIDTGNDPQSDETSPVDENVPGFESKKEDNE